MQSSVGARKPPLYAYVIGGLKMEPVAQEKAPFLLMCKVGYVWYSFKSM